MSKVEEGDKVYIEATVSRVSDDGAEVTVRLAHYSYPVTLPVNSVERKPEPKKASPDGNTAAQP